MSKVALKTVEAIYEDGVFKPVRKIPLKEKQRVTIEIRPAAPSRRRGPSVASSEHQEMKIVGFCDSGLGDLAEHHDFYLYGAPKKRG